MTAKALLAVYLRAVYIADAETAAALHEYMHPERADLFVCTVGRDICTATRVDFDEAEREIAKKQAAALRLERRSAVLVRLMKIRLAGDLFD